MVFANRVGMGALDAATPSSAPTDAFRIEGVGINVPTMHKAVELIARACQERQSFTVFTLNLDHCVKLRGDGVFREAYQRARFVTADGFPIVALGRLLGQQLYRTTGADMVDPLCATAAEHRIPVFMMGTSDSVLRRASTILDQRHPGLVMRGTYAPSGDFDPHSSEAAEAIARIRMSGARLCFVALGAPKQELFADRAAKELDGVGFACVGGALDFIAGHQVRAPLVFRKAGAEWLWRLATNPRRLATRYVRCAALLGGYLAEMPRASGRGNRSLGRA